VDDHAAGVDLDVEVLDERVGPHTDAPQQRPGRDALPRAEQDALVGRLLHRLVGVHLDPALAQDRGRGPREVLVEPGEHLAPADQHPAHVVRVEAAAPREARVNSWPCAATSVPVYPAPTTTKVHRASRSSGSSLTAARSI
jgi:hypothetical protein